MTEDALQSIQNIQETTKSSAKKLQEIITQFNSIGTGVADMSGLLQGLNFQPLHEMVARDSSADVPMPYPELAVTIVDNGTYNAALKQRMKSYIDKIADKSNIRRVICFLNKKQVNDDEFHKYVTTNKGLMLDFDTMWAIFRTTTVAERTLYMENTAPVATAYHFDDMHNNSVDEIKKAVTFIRQFTDKPIYGTINADDFRTVLDKDGRPVKDPRTGKNKKEPVDVQAYKDAGVLITRQFFRHTEPTSVLEGWLNAANPKGTPGGEGRIIDGVNLEAYQEGVITSADDFEDMFLRCLEHDVPFLSAYAVVNGKDWLMWEKSPPLWNAVNRAARYLRMLKIQRRQT